MFLHYIKHSKELQKSFRNPESAEAAHNMELIKRQNQRQHGLVWTDQSGRVFPVQGSLLTLSPVPICIYSWWLNLMDIFQQIHASRGKSCVPLRVLINCTQWGTCCLLGTTLLISNVDVPVGPPGMQTLSHHQRAGMSAHTFTRSVWRGVPPLFHSVMVTLCPNTTAPCHLPFLFSAHREQPVFPTFHHHGSNQLMLWGALLGWSADHASALRISLLSLWFNTKVIFCDQMADASLPSRTWLYPF